MYGSLGRCNRFSRTCVDCWLLCANVHKTFPSSRERRILELGFCDLLFARVYSYWDFGLLRLILARTAVHDTTIANNIYAKFNKSWYFQQVIIDRTTRDTQRVRYSFKVCGHFPIFGNTCFYEEVKDKSNCNDFVLRWNWEFQWSL